MDLLFIIVIIIIIFIILLLFMKKNEYENFVGNNYSKTKNDTSYLYPTKGLYTICAEENLKPSYMPKACYVDGNLNNYANCKCEDKEGNCKICYLTIKKDSHNSSVVYQAGNFS